MRSRTAVSLDHPGSWSASGQDLISYSKERPPEPIVDGLLNVGNTLLLHGNEENFKSFFVLQLAYSMATATHLLRRWSIPEVRTVGVVDTEMNPASLGARLDKMLPPEGPPWQMQFLDKEIVDHWRREKMDAKFELLCTWVRECGIDILIMDTVNDFFRGNENPSDERAVGHFFDCMRTIPAKARILVRHDRKKKEHDGGADSNQLIRGSSRFKEDPETILHLHRKDKRTHQVTLEVGKVRYGSKPEPQDLWFDAGSFRLTPLPPVIAVLEGGLRTREELLAECQSRFGIAQRAADDMVDVSREFLFSGQDGHKRTLQIDPERASNAPWWNILVRGARSSASNEGELHQPASTAMQGSSGPVSR